MPSRYTYPRMYWADRVAKEIIDSGKFKPYWVDDMFTPSGYPHVGSLRGPLVHDFVYKALTHISESPTFTYVFNDFDVIDGLPEELDNFSKYLGFPLRTVPSPQDGFDSFADYFASDFKKVLKTLGVEVKYLSSWDMYHEGKFDEVIKEALDSADKTQDIYQKVSGSNKREMGWLPLQIICEKCGKLGTTRVHDWDQHTVAYKCEPKLVVWAGGCSYEGRISPFGGNGKLPWKVDWPAHWKVIGVTIEGAGKDHSSVGGSRDIARELSKEVFHYPEPYNLPYEFYLFGGKKMSSSKGIGLKARELTGFLPPSVARFLFARTDYRQAYEISLEGTMAIPNLFDEYDKCYRAYVEDGDENLSRTFKMSQIVGLPPKENTFLPRFRDVVNYVQLPNVREKTKFEEIKGDALTELELKILDERIEYAKIWLEKYAPDDFKFEMSIGVPESAANLTEEQKDYLASVIPLLEKKLGADDLQQELYNLAKVKGIGAKHAFASIYLIFLGKEFGPKAGAFLSQYPKEQVIERLKEAIK